MLEMKKECLDCSSELNDKSDAYICSYECTYCEPCAGKVEFVCKNCGGDLQKRPQRDA